MFAVGTSVRRGCGCDLGCGCPPWVWVPAVDAGAHREHGCSPRTRVFAAGARFEPHRRISAGDRADRRASERRAGYHQKVSAHLWLRVRMRRGRGGFGHLNRPAADTRYQKVADAAPSRRNAAQTRHNAEMNPQQHPKTLLTPPHLDVTPHRPGTTSRWNEGLPRIWLTDPPRPIPRANQTAGVIGCRPLRTLQNEFEGSALTRGHVDKEPR